MKFKQNQIVAVFSAFVTLTMSGYFLESTKSNRTTHIDFESTEVDIGKLIQNHPGTILFSFENTGDSPLPIYSADASCGCTQPEYPGEPVSPGEKGEIKVTFDAKAPGKFIKSITIYHNGENNFDV